MDGKTDPKLWATVTVLVAVISCIGLMGGALIQVLPDLIKPDQTHISSNPVITPLNTTEINNTNTPPVTVSTIDQATEFVHQNVALESSSKLYVLGYSSNDLAVNQAIVNCGDCQVVYLGSLSELPSDWNHYSFNLASLNKNFPDGCRTKQELIGLGVTLMIANNYTPCTAVYGKSTIAILVGVTNQTDFDLTAASNYSYVANVEDVDAAILELNKVYSNFSFR